MLHTQESEDDESNRIGTELLSSVWAEFRTLDKFFSGRVSRPILFYFFMRTLLLCYCVEHTHAYYVIYAFTVCL